MEIGDVVELKSGGDKMTVVSIEPEIKGENGSPDIPRQVHCTWFSGSEVKESSFPEPALEKAKKKSVSDVRIR